jgi:outer membrane protein assembly factor BamB
VTGEPEGIVMTHLEVMNGSPVRQRIVGRRGLLVFLLLIGGLVAWATGAQAGGHPRFNQKGNLLIVDQYNNRVIELDTNTQTIVWEYKESVAKHSVTNAIIGPRDAERVKNSTLIVCGGLPAGVSTNCPDGCPDNRVIQVSRKGKITWQYGQQGVTGTGANELNDPVAAMMLPHKKVLITDQGNHRVMVVSRKGEITWQYGTTGVSGVGSNQLSSPSSVQHLGNGHYLIADTGNNRIIEVNKKQQILWQYGDPAPASTNILNGPTYACRLSHSHTLITDSLNNRIVELDNDDNNVFTYVTAGRSGSVEQPHPNRAVRMKKGNTLISDQFNQQVIEVDATGAVVFVHGTIGVPGDGDTLLNTPCDAKVVDDYTGLTSPKSGGGSGFNYGSLLF